MNDEFGAERINKKSKIVRWIKIILLIYFVIGFSLYFLQEKILFHPEPLSKDYHYSFNSPFKEVNIEIGKEENLNLIQFLPDSVPIKGVVLYFHGNMKNINHYAKFAKNFTMNGYEVWMPDYPGFGKTTGNLTEKKLYENAAQVYKLANKRFMSDSIIIYGRSLGTGVASQLATRVDCRQLILETPYYSIPDLFRSYAPIYPSSLMAKFIFPVYQYLTEVKVPITIFHGDDDEVIPYRCANKLKTVLKKGDEFITVPKGKHNNLFQFEMVTKKLDSLLRN